LLLKAKGDQDVSVLAPNGLEAKFGSSFALVDPRRHGQHALTVPYSEGQEAVNTGAMLPESIALKPDAIGSDGHDFALKLYTAAR
jgi:hypothetical protein